MPSRALGCALAATSLALLGACSADTSAGPSASRSSAPPELGQDGDSRWDADQQAVIDTVAALNDWYGQALSDPADPRFDLKTLRSLTGGPYTRTYGRTVAVQQSNGAEMRGAQVFHPLEVTVEGEEATAVTCLDTSSMEMFMTYAKPEQKVKPGPPTRVTFALRSAEDSPTGWEVVGRTGKGRCEPA